MIIITKHDDPIALCIGVPLLSIGVYALVRKIRKTIRSD